MEGGRRRGQPGMKAARAFHAGHTRAVRLHSPRLGLLGFYVPEEGRAGGGRHASLPGFCCELAQTDGRARASSRVLPHALHSSVTSPQTLTSK